VRECGVQSMEASMNPELPLKNDLNWLGLIRIFLSLNFKQEGTQICLIQGNNTVVMTLKGKEVGESHLHTFF